MIYGLGERLQTLRKKKGLSQKEVSDILGISASIISNYESSERTPSLENLILLAGFYRCSTDYLLGIEKSSDKKSLDVSMLTNEQAELLRAFLISFDERL